MTVRELRELLSHMDQDADVVFACDYGDHVHTQQALEIGEAEEIALRAIVRSPYSLSGRAIDEEIVEETIDDVLSGEEDAIVVLRS